jgi:hypothetical protein
MDNVTQFGEVWAWFGEMDEDGQKNLFRQIAAKVSSLALLGVREVLDSAPLPIKKYVWAAWANGADLSGYLLADILELNETESTEVTYGIVKAWLEKVNLSRYNDAQVTKMEQSLTTYEDRVKLWVRWSTQADLRMYKLFDFCVLMSRRVDTIQPVMMQAWVTQNGQRAEQELKSLRGDARNIKRINALCLSKSAVDVMKRHMS